MALTENEKRSDKKEKPLTKVLIRRLPPTMTQDQFLNQVSPVPDYNYVYFVKGDMSLGDNAFSRAYINFICPEDVYSFKERFDNYVFVDSKGHEYPAVVEFAPFQKIPKKRGKNRMDPKCNTIETDSYYLDFVANLNKPLEQEEKPEYTLQLNEKNDENKDSTTPLLEYIKNKRAQRLKLREVRREERERRRKEFERKKEYNKYEGKYHDDRKFEERSPAKGNNSKINSPKSSKTESLNDKVKSEFPDDKPDKSQIEKPSQIKHKERKFEERREKKEIKPRFPKKEYLDNRDFKRDDYSHREYRSKHYDDYKREDGKTFPKKIKKYSERREERKIEAQKAELKKLELRVKDSKETVAVEIKSTENSPKSDKVDISAKEEGDISDYKPKENDEERLQKQLSYEKEAEKEEKKKEALEKSDPNFSKRIRNKDRPTIPLYRPGMLSKRKQTDEDTIKTELKE